jgi:hypothetical protein
MRDNFMICIPNYDSSANTEDIEISVHILHSVESWLSDYKLLKEDTLQ